MVLWQHLHQIILYLLRLLLFCKAQLPGNTLYMGIHHNTGFIVYIPTYNIGCLTSHAGKGGKLVYGLWHLSAEPFHQVPAAGNDILSFHVIKPNGVDILFQFL